MVNFTLANFYNGFFINNLFFDLIKDKRMLRMPVSFNQIAGSFPFNSWAGDINSCLIGNIATYGDIEQCFQANLHTLRLDFSNIFLDEKEFYNNYNRIMLEQGSNGATIIEVANLKLYEYIKENYPTYNKFVLAPSAWLIADITPEMLNVILENPDFILASLPHEYACNEDYVSQIEAKDKLEITVNPICRIGCKNYKECHMSENQNQFDFSGNSNICTCPWVMSYSNNRQTLFMNDLAQFQKKGINHFRVSTSRPSDLVEYFLFLIKYFIKEEYQQDMIEQGMLLITANMAGGQ